MTDKSLMREQHTDGWNKTVLGNCMTGSSLYIHQPTKTFEIDESSNKQEEAFSWT